MRNLIVEEGIRGHAGNWNTADNPECQLSFQSFQNGMEELTLLVAFSVF